MIRFLSSGWTRVVASALLLSLAGSACQKKRSPEFVQGDGEYIYSIAAFDGKTYDLTTKDLIAPGIASDADEVVLSEGNSVIRSFDAVEFEADIELTEISDKILNDFSFFGKAGSEDSYKLQLGFTENHLIVYKVADEADIPSNEMTYAIPVAESGKYKVPMLGYPLSKYVVEYVEDSRGKKTKQKTSIPKDFLADSTHFSVDTSSVVYFDDEEKINLLPTTFFDEADEWFYEVTVVDGPLNTQLGSQLGAGKARFTRTSNSLMAVDVNIPEEAQDLSGEKLPRILQLPVRWVEFKLAQTGADALLTEKLLDEKDAGAVDWKQRPYGLFDFRRINNLDSANANSIRVRRLEIDDDYFSVTIASSDSGTAIHYSFARDNSKIEGKTYPALDRRKFGFWRHLKQFYPGQLTTSEKNVERNISLGRMYPEDNVINVYLTDNTPDVPGFLRAIEAAVEAWDEAFVEAARGSKWENNPIRVKLNLDKRVKNGDVRYNKISFYDFNINVGGLLGYGPSVTDERNGQIFSSTNHIYLRTYREGVYRDLKSYIRNQLGLFDDLGIDSIEYPNQILRNTSNLDITFDNVADVQTDMFARELGYGKSESEVSFRSYASSDVRFNYDFQDSINRAKHIAELGDFERSQLYNGKDFAKFQADKFKALSKFGNHSGSCNYRAAVINTFAEIERECGNLRFGRYVEDLRASKDAVDLTQLDFPDDIFNECAMKLLEPTLRSTLVHEFGHNLGLTHNFMGSADDDNFWRNEDGIPVSRSTSVMDYPDADEDRGFKPGPYDVAAIRYGYYGMVELKENDETGKPLVVSIDSGDSRDTRPIEERLDDPSKLRNYLYCWDFDITEREIPNEDPKCRRWDRGSNPVQMAYALIDRFNSLATMRMARFENVSLGNPTYYIDDQVLLPLRTLYVQYRYKLYLKTKELNDPYFVKNEANFDEFIKTFVGDISLADLEPYKGDDLALEKFVESLDELQQYKLASDVIFKFFKELAFADDRYCTVWDVNAENGEKVFSRAYSFAKVRSKIFNLTRLEGGLSVANCQEAAPFITEKGKNQIVDSYGNSFKDIKYTANDAIFEQQWTHGNIANVPYLDKDSIQVGLSIIRLFAFQHLTARDEPFAVNSLGEPVKMVPFSVANQNSFAPSFMDNKNYRRELLGEFEQRLANGVDKARFGADPRNFDSESDRFLSQFSEEQGLLAAMYFNLLQSVYAPGENAVSRLKELRPDKYNRADFERIFPAGSDARKGIAYVRSADGEYFVSEDPSSPIYRLIKRFEQVQDEIATTTSLEQLKREKERAISVAMRVQSAFFEEFTKDPEVDLNLLKLYAIDKATKVLAEMYVPAPEPSEEATVPVDAADEGEEVAPAEPVDTSDGEAIEDATNSESLVVVDRYINEAIPYIELAIEGGVTIDSDFIKDLLLELNGAEELERSLVGTLLDVIKPDEYPFIDLAYSTILQKRAYLAENEVSTEENDLKIVSSVYATLVFILEAEKLSPENFSEKGAQETILRSVILR